MNRRATFTQAELTRAIKAAEAAGKLALQTRDGIAFVDRGMLAQTPPDESKVDEWFRQNGHD